METIRDDVIGGFNSFLAEQKELPGEARLTYTQFDNVYEVMYAGKTVKSAPKLDRDLFVPRGNTALLDAVGRTLNEQGARIAAEKWAELVVVCIITDGQENASREYTRPRIAEMIKHAEANGWKFIFLAANQDAFTTAQGMGMSAANSMSANYASSGANAAASTNAVYGAASATLGNLRGGSKSMGLSDEWKKKLEEANKTPAP